MEKTIEPEVDLESMKLVDTRTAANYLSISSHTLELMRVQKRGPAYYRVGPRLVRYAISDLNDYVSRETT